MLPKRGTRTTEQKMTENKCKVYLNMQSSFAIILNSLKKKENSNKKNKKKCSTSRREMTDGGGGGDGGLTRLPP